MSAATRIMLIAVFMVFVGVAEIAANQGYFWGRVVVVLLALLLVAGLLVAIGLWARDRGDNEGGDAR